LDFQDVCLSLSNVASIERVSERKSRHIVLDASAFHYQYNLTQVPMLENFSQMPASSQEREDQLLGAMMQYLMQGKEGVSFKQLSKDLKFMERTKSWRNSWKVLIGDKHYIEASAESSAMFSDDYQLTQAGKDHASTPEYQEFLQEMNFAPQSNEEFQERLKKRLLNDKAREMFDALLKYGCLSRKELSTIIGVNDRSHAFSYGLRSLKEKDLVTHESNGKGKKIKLTNEAFLDPEDRPVPVDLASNVLAEGANKIESRKRKKCLTDSDEYSRE
jgi:hypothetical protein